MYLKVTFFLLSWNGLPLYLIFNGCFRNMSFLGEFSLTTEVRVNYYFARNYLSPLSYFSVPNYFSFQSYFLMQNYFFIRNYFFARYYFFVQKSLFHSDITFLSECYIFVWILHFRSNITFLVKNYFFVQNYFLNYPGRIDLFRNTRNIPEYEKYPGIGKRQFLEARAERARA